METIDRISNIVVSEDKGSATFKFDSTDCYIVLDHLTGSFLLREAYELYLRMIPYVTHSEFDYRDFNNADVLKAIEWEIENHSGFSTIEEMVWEMHEEYKEKRKGSAMKRLISSKLKKITG